MRMSPHAIGLFAALSAAGCAVFTDGRHELYSTETFRVSPQNGVWDDEYGRTVDAEGCSFEFRVVRYRDGFGVRARVFDDRVVTDDCAPGSTSCPSWDDDNLECFFDGDNDRSTDARAGRGLEYGGEYTMVANGATQSDYSGHPRSFGRLWKGKSSVRARDGGGFVIDYDLWFSWLCIGRRSAPADDEDVTFGFNICIHDDDDGGRNDRALYWKGNPARPYRDESRFGTIVLEGVK
ncbi:MAG: hypothetical protein IJI73_03445 [Kiritimatiellae bacterium]|nr:hypothetical protein [Kiritimatiellia bacterium]